MSEEGMAPAETAFSDVPAGLRDAVEALLAEYYEVWESLSADNHAAAVQAAGRLAEHARGVAFEDGPSDLHKAWDETAAAVVSHAVVLSRARDIESARFPLEPLSNEMARLVRRFGASGKTPVYLLHCPMAHGDGADWLQPDAQTANPYYGASMYRCGAVAETLRAGSAGTEN